MSQQNGHLKWHEVYQNRGNNINNSKNERFGIFEPDQNDRVCVYPYRFDKVIAQAFQFSHELSQTQMVRLSL